jgi:hypothetical protein
MTDCGSSFNRSWEFGSAQVVNQRRLGIEACTSEGPALSDPINRCAMVMNPARFALLLELHRNSDPESRPSAYFAIDGYGSAVAAHEICHDRQS